MEIFLGERLHIKLPLLVGYASHPIFSKNPAASSKVQKSLVTVLIQ